MRRDLPGRLVVVAAIAACGAACGAPATPQPLPLANRAGGLSLDLAHDLERGDGAPRDYARSAAIYAALCTEGHGLPAACYELVDAIRGARGVSYDEARVAAIGRVLCDGGDDVGCALAPADDRHPRADAAPRLLELCRRGSGRACVNVVVAASPDASERAQELRRGVACRAGLVDACGALAQALAHCAFGFDPARCEQSMRRRGHGDATVDDAYDRLFAACDRGDARACAYIPSRHLPFAELCAAHDYGACADLGCLGDDAARAVADAHAAPEPSCHDAGSEALALWRVAKSPTLLPPVAADRFRIGEPQEGMLVDAIRVEHHGGRDRHGWPRLDLYDSSTRDATAVSVCVYAYDRNGQQVAWFRAAHAVDVSSNHVVELPIDDPAAEPDLYDDDTIIVDVDHLELLGEVFDDPSRCPAQRPTTQGGLTMGW
nr:hypothetical protein [Kofleriaceae bacterium]